VRILSGGYQATGIPTATMESRDRLGIEDRQRSQRFSVLSDGNFVIAGHADLQILLLLGKQDRVLWLLHDRKNILGYFLK
jgi:hypothetical protein